MPCMQMHGLVLAGVSATVSENAVQACQGVVKVSPAMRESQEDENRMMKAIARNIGRRPLVTRRREILAALDIDIAARARYCVATPCRQILCRGV